MAGLLDYLGDAGGLLGGFANNNSNALIGLGAGIASGATDGQGWGPGISQGLQGFLGGRQADQKNRVQNASIQALIARGFTPEQAFLAANNSEIMKAIAPAVVPKMEAFSQGQSFGVFNPYDKNGPRITGTTPSFHTVPEGAGAVEYKPGAAAPPIGSTDQIVPRPVPTIPQPPFVERPAPVVPPPMPPADVRVGQPLVTNKDQSRAGSIRPLITGTPKAEPGYEWVNPNDRTRGQRRIIGGPAEASDIGKLADDFRADPNVKRFQEVAPIMQSAREARHREGGAADLNIIYAMGKLFDPGSVVREAELIMGQRSSGPVEAMQGLASYLNSGQKLTPLARARILGELESRYQKLEQSHDAARDHYKSRAESMGIDPSKVLYSSSPSVEGTDGGWSITPRAK